MITRAKASDSVELYVSASEDPDFRYVQCWAYDDLRFRIKATDISETARRTFGSDEYEYWYDLEPTDSRGLLLALMSDRFGGRPEGMSEFKSYLDAKGIKHTFNSWV